MTPKYLTSLGQAILSQFIFIVVVTALSLAVSAADTLPGAAEQTFAIIKPNAVRKNVVGAILEKIEKSGLKIAAMKMTTLSKGQCETFYSEHKGKPFFGSLISFMSSGPSVLLVLTGENAVTKHRENMGPTDPKKAPAGTIRAMFGDSVAENSIHGSDSIVNSKREISLFFKDSEITAR